MKGELAFPAIEQHLLQPSFASGVWPRASFPSLPSQVTEYAPANHFQLILRLPDFPLTPCNPLVASGKSQVTPGVTSGPSHVAVLEETQREIFLNDSKPADEKKEPSFPSGRRGEKEKQSYLIHSAFKISKRWS